MMYPQYSPKVSLAWSTANGDQMIADMARVSVKENKGKSPDKLIAYMMKHGHVSPFSMVNMCVEVVTTRDISRQILRHWSIHVQEFSQRYALVEEDMFVIRECRMQHSSNKQMSVDVNSESVGELSTKVWWEGVQESLIREVRDIYEQAINRGIAKEQARVILPEGNTLSRLYLNGTVRSWVFYLKSRMDIDTTQREHVAVAKGIAEVFSKEYPITYKAFFGED